MARQDSADGPDSPNRAGAVDAEQAPAGARYRVDVSLPDEATILRKHAAVVVTVPMTTLLGLDDRPGTIAGAPVPADMARMIASRSTVWSRMLTDPATGRVLDTSAQRYVPDRGGRTEPANLHPLCRRHHQAKTAGRLRMRRISADEIEWVIPLGESGTITPEEARARVWAEYLAEEEQWEVHVEQVRERQRTALRDDRARFQAWMDGQRAILQKEKDWLALESRHIERQRDRVTTD